MTLPSTHSATGWNLEHSYTKLPNQFYSNILPTPVRCPHLVLYNALLATSLGLKLHTLPADNIASILAGNSLPEGAHPIAQAYAGHQFGHFNMLGDGRAILLGEQVTPDNARYDIQLKGAGRTPYSRSGDGRAALAPMLREYIISEAMYALDIPTTRCLAVVTTGEPVFRQTLLPGAVLTRVAASHIRVGTFEYAAALGDIHSLKALADYAISRHYSGCTQDEQPYFSFLNAVIERQASLIAKWMLVGFIHGVMNTDNMAISGETIDYGPCAFMDQYDPTTCFSSIDRHGRYAYANQPLIAQWNLARFAESLLPLLHPETSKAVMLAEEAIKSFDTIYQTAWLNGMRRKLGLINEDHEDTVLIKSLLTWMQQTRADFTYTFYALTYNASLYPATLRDSAFDDWYTQWQVRLSRNTAPLEVSKQLMHSHNPVIIPRNHYVEVALTAATETEDFSHLQNLLAALATPFNYKDNYKELYQPPSLPDIPYQTFCGT